MSATYIGQMKIAAKRLGMTYDAYMTRLAAGDKWCSIGAHWAKATRFGPDSYCPSGLSPTCRDCDKKISAARTTIAKRRAGSLSFVQICRGGALPNEELR